ncbi:MAG: S-methyl-5'-thioadenosine phosphorylase [Deltaproteobacteria bacterium]|jgi:5'-methylthioadenosine phosphorylase|nr:S-methyl-5'-thioadenosine phosphorylase [Deltaproteobacteria bacterium]MBT6432714.1 S-methyl-5'-thioadenosine phosphorylase [Deltaproteobacteria bacterium]MBT6488741.1 S-methyl-5'-thioadenosine phosphorylase [Deltaproteobacteria bacterium]
MSTIAIIGGSGLYELDGLEDVQEVTIDTPFGPTSDKLITGKLGGANLIFVPRHGRGHKHLPSEVPYRANIYALKQMGATWVLSVSAVGSMRKEIVPGHFVLPDQFIDRTSGRTQTFFGDGIVAHVSMADPVCPVLKAKVAESVRASGITLHENGTYMCMEGPAFSSRAESNMYRQWGVSVIGMTACPEVKLAREAELRYATLALSTDYDCWHEEEDDVNVESVLEILKRNTANVKVVLKHLIPELAKMPSDTTSPCDNALEHAIITNPDAIPEAAKEKLAPLVKRYLG